MHSYHLFLLCFLVFYGSSSILGQNYYNLQLLSQEKGQACIDGSAPGYYIHQGSQKKKFLIHFQDGKYCAGTNKDQTLQSCYQRSSTPLGSTKQAQSLKSFSGQGILSTQKQQNPIFHDWTKIFVIYCDGSAYLGNRLQPIQYKGKKLYFKGGLNAIQTFQQLNKKYGLYDASDIILTGLSVGGNAVFQWSSYVAQRANQSEILLMPDSGISLMEYISPILGIPIPLVYSKSLIQIVYNEDYLPEPILKCADKQLAEEKDIGLCINPVNYVEFLKLPTFIIQSHYDVAYLTDFVFVNCMENVKPPFSIKNCDEVSRQAIQDYREKSQASFEQIRNKMDSVGFWSPACIQHGFLTFPSYKDMNFKADGVTLNYAVKKFMKNPENPPTYQDICIWPTNQGCSGLNNN